MKVGVKSRVVRVMRSRDAVGWFVGFRGTTFLEDRSSSEL